MASSHKERLPGVGLAFSSPIAISYFPVRVNALPEWNTIAGSPGWWSCSVIEYIVLAAVVPRLWTPVTVP
jgi:hypothetical protein